MKRCSYCVMDDSSDSTIVFDDNGRCNYCKDAEKQIGSTTYFPNEEGANKFNNLISFLKRKGIKKKYDCLMGISGGLDSAYLAYLGYKAGLRILAVHIDDGFDTEICKSNIEKLINATGIDLLTIKPNSIQFNALEKAYLLAQVPNITAPQDNVLFAFLYKTAIKNKIKYFLSGGNFSLECILQNGNTHSASDVKNIKDINKKFGSTKLDQLEFISSFKKRFIHKFFGLKTYRPLNYIDYNRDRAFNELYEFCGFEYYGSKHLENYFTMFTQLYWMPNKFNVDKRKSHLSSMIVSKQISREEALSLLEKPLCEPLLMEKCLSIVKKALLISDSEFDEIMKAPIKSHNDYKTEFLVPFLLKIRKKIKGF